MFSFFRRMKPGLTTTRRRAASRKPRLEVLEDRTLLSIGIDLGPIINPANGHTYYRLTQSNWTDAETYAVNKLGGHLATINDAAENDWVFSTFCSPTDAWRSWIGLNDLGNRFTYSWVSGDSSTYRNWAPGQPSLFGNGPEDCVELKVEPGGISQWNDLPDKDRAGGLPGEAPMKGIVEVATKPDIAPTSLTWNTTQGGVDFSYEVSNNPVATDTTVAIYWSSSEKFADRLGQGYPIDGTTTDIPVGMAVGTYGPFHVDAATLGTPPDGATHLLAVTDPENLVGNFSEANNVKALNALPDIVLNAPNDKATTTDATTVTINYDINGANVNNQDLHFAIYRSATPGGHDAAGLFATATLDASDTADLTEAHHEGVKLNLQDPNNNTPIGDLAPDPEHPYVVVVANPDGNVKIAESDAADEQNNVTWFQKHLLGVIAHGFEPPFIQISVPDWETNMASLLRQKGYEDVIPFDWVDSSRLPIPGLAIEAGDSLFTEVVARADQMAAVHNGDVVDIHFIGHSRGAVVISQTLQDLDQFNKGTPDPHLQGGYLKMTLLDPHPANNSWFANSFSVSSDKLGTVLAKGYRAIQAGAQDPPVVVPPNVKVVDMYFQHTTVKQIKHGDKGTFNYEKILNLWGQTPDQIIIVDRGVFQTTQDLTNFTCSAGVVGHSEVPIWYMENVLSGGFVANLTQPNSPRAVAGPGVLNDRLKGGDGNNILVGGVANDTLIGGNAKDLFIGGFGTNQLHSDAGYDFIIGGTAAVDAKRAALNAIMAEWRRSGVDLATPVSHLNGTLSGGNNAGYFLTATTVHDDSAVDTLFGDAGSDWYFYLATGIFKDTLKDNGLGDIFTRL